MRQPNERPPNGVVEEFIHFVWNRQKFELIHDYIDEEYHVNAIQRGPDWVQQNVTNWHTAFPDLSIDPLQIISHKNQVASLVRITGTHEGVWRGIDPTGREIDVLEAGFWHLRGRKIEHGTFVADTLAIRQQLGLFDGLALPSI